MGLKITPIVFTPQTLIKSADMNSNFTAITTATNFDGSWEAANNSLARIGISDISYTPQNSGPSVNAIKIAPDATSVGRDYALGYINSSVINTAWSISSGFGLIINGFINDNCGPYFSWLTGGTFVTSGISGPSATFNHGWPGIPTYFFGCCTVDSSAGTTTLPPDYTSIGTVGSVTATVYISDVNNTSTNGSYFYTNGN